MSFTRILPVALLVATSTALMGCGHATTSYPPQLVARDELVLRYDDAFEMWGGGRLVARGPGYEGLPQFVGCVPKAKEHALQARDEANTSTVYAGLAIGLGTAALGGLAGFAFKDKPTTQGIIFGAGISSGVLGIIFGALSRQGRNNANGHAVDAMNYYNDEVGSQGKKCVPAGDLAGPR
jgi:hypothetical protein